MQASTMPSYPGPEVGRLRELRARSVHIRNGLYLFESGALSYGDMVLRLRQVVGDEELSALWPEDMVTDALEHSSQET